MKISMDVIHYLLPMAQPKNQTRATSSLFKYAALFQPDMVDPATDIIHIARVEELERLGAGLIDGLTLIPVGARGAVERLIKGQQGARSAWLLFPEDFSAPMILDCLQRLFARLNTWEAEINAAVYRDQDVQGVVSTIEPIVKDPILVWDNAFRIIAKLNDERAHSIDLLDRTLKEGRWPGDAVEHMLTKRDYLRKNSRYLELRHIPVPNMTGCHSCAKSFMVGDKVVMTLGAYFLDGGPHPGKMELLGILTSKIQEHIRHRRNYYTGSRKIYEQFVLELIQGDLTSEADIRERLQYIDYPFRSCFEVFIVEIDEYALSTAESYEKNLCKRIFPYAKIVNYQNRLVGLNNRARETDSQILARKKILLEMVRRGLIAMGVSDPFECLCDVSNAFDQAKIALHYGNMLNPGERYYLYRDYYVYYMIERLLANSNSPFFCHDAKHIYHLRTMDKKKNTNNESLLRTYLSCGRNTALTAKRMHLHRNSILYRIRQIESDLGVRLDDEEAVFHIMLGLKMVDLRDAIESRNQSGNLHPRRGPNAGTSGKD